MAQPYGLGSGQKARDVDYVQTLAGQILTELTESLNKFHQTQHSERYWNIVLGHWLQRYVAVAFHRYHALDQALKTHEIAGTTVFDSTDYSLATYDSMSFIWACNDPVWNHVFYAKILEFLGYARIEPDAASLRGIHGFVKKTDAIARRPSPKRLILRAANYILPKLSGRHDAFIINSFLPLPEQAKLELSFGQCPQLWRIPLRKNVAPSLEIRRHFGINSNDYQGFERFARSQLAEIIPTCYLEGYDQLNQQIKLSPWPAEPKFIFTSNNFDLDESFKVWAGSKVEEGIPYFVGQHGSNYGTLRGSQNWPELVTCDKFFTWGWSNGNARNIPAFVFTTAANKPRRRNSDGGLLLIELHPSLQLGPEDDYHDFGIYQEEQFRFVAALPESIQQRLTVRLHHLYRELRWSDEQRWKDRLPQVRIENYAVPIQELIAQSRLVVHSYDSAGILETLALNIPTLCFWHGGLDHLLYSAKPYYELLRGASILVDTPEQGAAFVASHWENINEWWESEKVQDARNRFCDQYARTERKPVWTMKRLLTTALK